MDAFGGTLENILLNMVFKERYTFSITTQMRSAKKL
jgi:hypothetical protein